MNSSRYISFVVVAILVLPLFGRAADEPGAAVNAVKGDMKQLQGKWRIIT